MTKQPVLRNFSQEDQERLYYSLRFPPALKTPEDKRDDKTARSPDAKSTKNPCHPEAKRGVVTGVVKEDVDSDAGGIWYLLRIIGKEIRVS